MQLQWVMTWVSIRWLAELVFPPLWLWKADCWVSCLLAVRAEMLKATSNSWTSTPIKSVTHLQTWACCTIRGWATRLSYMTNTMAQGHLTHFAVDTRDVRAQSFLEWSALKHSEHGLLCPPELSSRTIATIKDAFRSTHKGHVPSASCCWNWWSYERHLVFAGQLIPYH